MSAVGASTGVSQPTRAVVQLKWTADSVWEGTYFQKPHRFQVHEELEGRLVLDVPDPSFFARPPKPMIDPGAAPVRAIQLRDDGSITNATLVEAAGTTLYRSDVLKEGGDCGTLADSLLSSGPPFSGQESATATWDARAPGALLIVFRGAQPVSVAFAPKSLTVESAYRLLCEKPESVKKLQRYRVTARTPRDARLPAGTEGSGQWTTEVAPDDDFSGYTITARYRASATQNRPVVHDAAASIGRLEVTKTFVISWRPADR